MTRRGASLHRQGQAELRDAIATTEAAEQRQRDEARARAASARQAERERVRLTRDDVLGATHVRDRWGWYRVLKVNAASVRVDDPDYGERLLAIHRVLEVRHPVPSDVLAECADRAAVARGDLP